MDDRFRGHPSVPKSALPTGKIPLGKKMWAIRRSVARGWQGSEYRIEDGFGIRDSLGILNFSAGF